LTVPQESKDFPSWENTLDALTRIEEAGLVLDDVLDTLRYPDLRRTTASWLFTYFRHKRALQEYLRNFAAKPPAPALQRLLLLAAARMRFQNAVSPQSCANAAVACAKQQFGRGAANFVNAFLRRIARENPDFPVLLPQAVEERWKKRFSEEEISQFRRCFAEEAPFTYRLCGNSADGAAYGTAIALPPKAANLWRFYQTSDAGKLFEAGLLEKGLIYAQDPAATVAPSLGNDFPVRTILDLCAAPGGKTMLLHDRFSNAEITACDRSERRLKQAQENFNRHRLSVKTIVAKAEEHAIPGSFDLVLADVPCSNTGVFRRRPDALFRFSEAALAEVAALQKEILRSAAQSVAPGGLLLYSTCSIEKEEDSQQVTAFLLEHPAFLKEQEVLLFPSAEHDGAYACALRRIS